MNHVIQQNRDTAPRELFTLPRVDYDAILNDLVYPVVWVHDDYLDAWLPVETTADRISQGELTDPIEGRVDWDTLRQNFARDGFVRVPHLIPESYAKGTLSSHFWRRGEDHKRWPEMMGIIRLSINNLPIMRLLHQAIEQKIKYVVNQPIKTSYSFASAYEKGSALPEHIDRPQCIYNVSLLLSGSPGNVPLSSWPLFIKHDQKVNRIELEHGDAVVYSGTRDPHWRDTMPGSLYSVLGVFFHFVDENFSGSLD